jgi:hypothetical protein
MTVANSRLIVNLGVDIVATISSVHLAGLPQKVIKGLIELFQSFFGIDFLHLIKIPAEKQSLDDRLGVTVDI